MFLDQVYHWACRKNKSIYFTFLFTCYFLTKWIQNLTRQPFYSTFLNLYYVAEISLQIDNSTITDWLKPSHFFKCFQSFDYWFFRLWFGNFWKIKRQFPCFIWLVDFDTKLENRFFKLTFLKNKPSCRYLFLRVQRLFSVLSLVNPLVIYQWKIKLKS